jgi:hypothetical protein
VLGLFLLLLGGLLMAENLGWDVPGSVWSYWPLLLIALGLTKMLWPGRAEERDSGFWLLAGGIDGWIATRELFGLGWGTAWPIMLIAAGVHMALEGGFGGRRRAPKEASDE